MSWIGLNDTDFVVHDNVLDAIANGVFTARNSYKGSGVNFITKSEVTSNLNVLIQNGVSTDFPTKQEFIPIGWRALEGSAYCMQNSFEFSTPWRFKDIGAQNLPLTRNYDANTLPIGALWSVSDNGYGLRISWDDSQNCGGSNAQIQSGTASAIIVCDEEELLGVSWEGIAEKQASSFEKMTLKIDGVLIGEARSPGGNLGCEMGPVVSINYYPAGYTLSPGSHTILVESSTVDSLYHVGSYYAFTFTKL